MERAITEHREFRFSDPVNVSGTNSVDARRKRAKYQGMRQTGVIGMGTWFFVGGLSQFGWPRSGMRTRQDEAGRGRTRPVNSARHVPSLDAILWLSLPMVHVSAMRIRVSIRTTGGDLSLKLVVFSQVPPPLALFSVWALRATW
jgi:hypothetical protein